MGGEGVPAPLATLRQPVAVTPGMLPLPNSVLSSEPKLASIELGTLHAKKRSADVAFSPDAGGGGSIEEEVALPAKAAAAFESLDDFRRSFPMDSQAFDYLQRSPKSVRSTVMSDFRPSSRNAQDRDFSKQVTSFVRSCLTARHGSGSILPVAKRTIGGF